MGLPALKDTFESVAIMPHSFKLGDVLGALDDVKAFERSVTKAAAALRVWKAQSMGSMRTALDRLKKEMVSMPLEDAASFLLPHIDLALDALDRQIADNSTPVRDRPEVANAVASFGSDAGPAGRFLRKQINRIEDLRVEQLNVLVDMTYGLMAFRSELRPDDGPAGAFDDADDLGAFLRSHVA